MRDLSHDPHKKSLGGRGTIIPILQMRKLILQVLDVPKSRHSQVAELGFTCRLEPKRWLIYL